MGRREWEMALRSCRNRVSLKTCPSDPLLKASGTDKVKLRRKKSHIKWSMKETTSDNQILSVSLIAKSIDRFNTKMAFHRLLFQTGTHF